MREESPNQFLDTIALFDYGFNNFQKINISENETNYSVNNSDLFNTDSDIFFSNDPIVEIDSNDCVIIPKTVTFADLTSSLSYETSAADPDSSSMLAKINYQYHGADVGSASITLTAVQAPSQTGSEETGPASISDSELPEESQTGGKVIFINILKVIGIILLVLILIIAAIFTIAFCRNYNFARRRRSRISRKRRRRNNTFRDDRFDFR